MKLLALFIVATIVSAQTGVMRVQRRVAAGTTVSLIAHGQNSSADAVASLAPGSCTGSACGAGGTINLAAHDFVYVVTAEQGGNCYTTPPTVTVTDDASTPNTYTEQGTGITNSYWGAACLRHFASDIGTAKTGATITASWATQPGTRYIIMVTVFRVSTAPASWAFSQDLQDGVNTSPVTSDSLGNAAANDVIVAGAAIEYAGAGVISAGTLGDGTGALASGTEVLWDLGNPAAAIGYKVQAGSTTGATATMAATVARGLVLGAVRARFTP